MRYNEPYTPRPPPCLMADPYGGSLRRLCKANPGFQHVQGCYCACPSTAWKGGTSLGVRFGLAYSSTACSFLMISPILHDIWAMFFLILSHCEKLVLLMLLRTSGDGYSHDVQNTFFLLTARRPTHIFSLSQFFLL